MKPADLKILTTIRFFAAFHVVLFHNFYLFGVASDVLPNWLSSLIGSGDMAVSFFFILSGFILTHAYQDRIQTRTEKFHYLIARVSKIYPLYVLAFMLDVPRVVSYFFSKYSINEAILKITVSAGAYLTMTQSWVPNLTPVWNSPAWSLSCELFFYLSFIFLMPLMKKSFRPRLLTIALYLIPAIIFLILEGVTDSEFRSPETQTFLRSFPLLRLFEFAIGILLYRCKNSILLREYASILFWASVIISITAGILVPISADVTLHVLQVPVFATIIASAATQEIFMGRIFKNEILVYLGKISYVVYIIHQPIKYYVELFLGPSLGTGLLYVALLMGVSAVAHQFIERPLQVKLSRRLSKALNLPA